MKAVKIHPELVCPYCGSTAKLTDGTPVYKTTRYGQVYICGNYPECDAYVGVHPNSDLPKGTLANPELREWRKAAHAKFDPLWQSKRITRKKGYMILAEHLEIAREDAHIGHFDIEQCKKLLSLMNKIEADVDAYEEGKGDDPVPKETTQYHRWEKEKESHPTEA
ncbi:zinc-finger-containing protein [Armatimonas sp.]|uniref:zinc-finger-containing protein n=1 Tax=Armatimonas sp. TaxID=1872638 RepID=UPI00286D2693|nr:zinc-finger-containing protein [Armatimonas sp.]